MKKTLIFLSLGLFATTLAIYPTEAHAATSGTTNITSQVTAGEFSITSTSPMNFTAVTYTGNPLIASSSGNTTITVKDARGSFAGWGVTVKQSQDTDQTWGTGMALTLTDTSDSSKTVSISTTNTNAFSQTASSTNYDVTQVATYSGSIAIPASVGAGNYATTLTWTLGATPTT